MSDFCVLCARLRISYLCISLVIGWVIQGANSLVFLTDRLNGKETDILFLFCVSAWIPWWCLWLFLHGWDDKNIRFSILILGVFKDQTLMTFVRVWASANACFPYSLFLSYLLVMFSSCIRVVFAWLWWQQHTFLDAETSLFLIVQGPNFDELCACLSQCTFIHCVNSMILICYPWCIHSELGLNYVFLVHLWWQFVYQMMLVDACFLCFLGSSNRSSWSGPLHRTVLDEDISIALFWSQYVREIQLSSWTFQIRAISSSLLNECLKLPL